MAKAVTETWNWPKISKRTTTAAVQAVTLVSKEAADAARPRVNVRTGRLRDSVDYIPAQVEPNGDVVGYVGYLEDLSYHLVQEIKNPAVRPAANSTVREIPKVMKQEVSRIK